MASTEKTAERTNLVLRLGRLLAGVHTLANGQVPPAPTEYQIAAAAFRPDFDVWRGDASRFVVVGGVRFDHELDDINRGLWDLLATLAALARDATSDAHEKQTRLRDCLVRCEKQTIAAIDAVPIGWEARLLAEKTPFSTYLAIYDAVRTAKRRLHYFDRYLDSDFFASICATSIALSRCGS